MTQSNRFATVLTLVWAVGALFGSSACDRKTNRVSVVDQLIHLGFETSIQESAAESHQVLGIQAGVSLDAQVDVAVDLPVRVRASYDPAEVFPAANLPLDVRYSPRNGADPEISLALSGQAQVSCHVPTWALVALTTHPVPFVTELALLCELLESQGDLPLTVPFDFAGEGDFTAPFDGDAPVSVPVTHSIPICIDSSLCLGDLDVTADVVVSPAPLEPIPGLSGGVVAIPWQLFPWPLQFDSSTEVETVVAPLPVAVTNGIAGELGPIVHWLQIDVQNVSVTLDLVDVFNNAGIGDVQANQIAQVDLGLLLDDADLDCTIGQVVGGEAATQDSDCGFVGGGISEIAAERVRQGILPIPYTFPELTFLNLDFPEAFLLGSLPFTIDMDRDDDGLVDGEELQAGTDPTDADTDDDNLSDAAELHCKPAKGSKCPDPLDPDSDDDGLNDGVEVLWCGTDPLDPDSDDDRIGDAEECDLTPGPPPGPFPTN